MKPAPEAKPPLVPVSRVLAAVAAVAMVLGLVQVANIVDLPFAHWLCGSTGSVFSSGALSDFLDKYGYLSLFVLMVAESASAPIPSEIVLPIAGFLTHGALGSLMITLVVSTVAALTGALIDYYLALFLGRPFVGKVLRVFRLDAKDLDRAEGWFERSGQWTVFAARFVPMVRALISFPAGLFRMGLARFVLMTVLGCAIWNGILVYTGFAAGSYLDNACANSNGAVVINGIASVVIVSATAYLGYYALMSHRGRRMGDLVTKASLES